MASTEDVALVVEKITAARALGDRCEGMAVGKSIAEWKDVFNEAARILGMPVIEITPLKGSSLIDAIKHVAEIDLAFTESAGKPAIILADSTGNSLQKDADTNTNISNFIEGLTKIFPQAVYIQMIPEPIFGEPIVMYCMNPKEPRDPSQPIRPV